MLNNIYIWKIKKHNLHDQNLKSQINREFYAESIMSVS
jgi:hypothetical protein